MNVTRDGYKNRQLHIEDYEIVFGNGGDKYKEMLKELIKMKK